MPSLSGHASRDLLRSGWTLLVSMLVAPTLTICCAMVVLLVGSSAWADEQVVAIPGQNFKIHLEAPAITVVAAAKEPPIFLGSSDRLRFTLSFNPVPCTTIESNEAIDACYTKGLHAYPGVDWETERSNTDTNGVRVSYMSKTTAPNGATGLIFNSDLLFVRDGKLVGFHIGIFSPTKDDIAAISSMLDSVAIEAIP